MMEVKIMHQDAFTYPGGDRDWAAIGLTPIGVVNPGDGGWFALALDERRQPVLVDGEGVAPLDMSDVGPAVYRALEAACERLWGNSWNSSVGEIFSLNRRTTQRDRVSKNLLPTRVLQMIAYVASADDGKELAETLIAVSRYAKRFKDKATVRRYMNNAIDVYYGDFDREIGVEPTTKLKGD